MKTIILFVAFSSCYFLKANPRSNTKPKVQIENFNEFKKYKAHIHFEFSPFGPGGLIFVIDGDINFTMDWSTNPPKVNVTSLTGTLCIRNTTYCDTFRGTNFYYNNGDLSKIDFSTNGSNEDIRNALKSNVLITELKAYLIENANQ